MFIDMLFKLIPRSIKAGVALVVTFIFLPFGLRGLGVILVDQSTVKDSILSVLAFIIGAAAGVTFYYFQAKAANAEYQGLEVLHKHYENEAQEKKLKDAYISMPKFPGDEKK